MLQKSNTFDAVSFLIDFESGTLSQEDTIAGFQELINSGLVWELQGCYGRIAVSLITAGLCVQPGHTGVA